MTNTFFVTGTDTEVGKTIASCALLQAAGQRGLRTVGYKPVASGSEMTVEGLRNSDALALQRNSVVTVDYAAILSGKPQSLKARLGTVGPLPSGAPDLSKALVGNS